MSSSVKARISEATKDAMRARDKARLGVLRLVNAAIKQVEVDERRELDDGDVLTVLEKMLKQRRDAQEQYEKVGRQDRADAEVYESEVIREFMPQALSEEEIDALIAQAIDRAGAGTVKDMGKVMGALRPALKGRADMRLVSEKVKQRLG